MRGRKEPLLQIFGFSQKLEAHVEDYTVATAIRDLFMRGFCFPKRSA